MFIALKEVTRVETDFYYSGGNLLAGVKTTFCEMQVLFSDRLFQVFYWLDLFKDCKRYFL